MKKLLNDIRLAVSWLINFSYPAFQSFIPPETFRYAVTGGLNTVFDIFLYFLFYNFVLDKQNLDVGIFVISPHIAAFIIVFPITFTSGFLLAKYITFTQSAIRGRIQLIRYGVSVSGSILLNYILLKFFVEHLRLWPTFSKAMTTGIVVGYSYFVQRFYAFKTANRYAVDAE
ncbi:MAG: GtrA family protein [Prolixibacteraceae bacterium]|nr:GtrA family protein [Prolixibacteraceae bacterium]